MTYRVKGGRACTPRPHQAGLNLSSYNICQKVAIVISRFGLVPGYDSMYYFSMVLWTHLFPGLEFLAVEAVEEKGEKEVEDHEVAHDQGGQEDGQAGLGVTLQIFMNLSHHKRTAMQ
jgi:hypothetical protein